MRSFSAFGFLSVSFIFFGSGTSAGVGGLAGIGLGGFGLCDVKPTPGCWFRGLGVWGFRGLGVSGLGF